MVSMKRGRGIYPRTPENRKKISETQKRRWQKWRKLALINLKQKGK